MKGGKKQQKTSFSILMHKNPHYSNTLTESFDTKEILFSAKIIATAVFVYLACILITFSLFSSLSHIFLSWLLSCWNSLDGFFKIQVRTIISMLLHSDKYIKKLFFKVLVRFPGIYIVHKSSVFEMVWFGLASRAKQNKSKLCLAFIVHLYLMLERGGNFNFDKWLYAVTVCNHRCILDIVVVNCCTMWWGWQFSICCCLISFQCVWILVTAFSFIKQNLITCWNSCFYVLFLWGAGFIYILGFGQSLPKHFKGK